MYQIIKKHTQHQVQVTMNLQFKVIEYSQKEVQVISLVLANWKDLMIKETGIQVQDVMNQRLIRVEEQKVRINLVILRKHDKFLKIK
jgi:hypothetical protein